MSDFKIVMPTTQEEWQRDCQIAYEQGKADYEAECQKIFEDNPPMHFNHEQIMWLKEFVKIRCNQARAEAIEEFRTYLKTVVPCEMPQDIWNIGVDNTCNRMLKE